MPNLVHRARLATAAVFLLSGIVLGVWATQVPLIKARLALPDASLGGALLCLALGACAAMPLAGPLAERRGAASVIRLGVLLAAPALPAAAMAPGLPTLCLALAVFGMGVGAIDVAMNAHAVAVEHALGRPVLSSLHAMWSLGGLAGSAGGAALLAVLPPGREAALPALLAAALAAAVLLTAPAAMLPATPRTPSPGPAPRPWRDPGLLLVGALMCGSFVVEGAMLDWSGVYLLGTRLMPASVAALGYSAFSAAMVAMRLAGDRVRVRLGSGGALWLALLGLAGLALALLAPGRLGSLAGFALVGAGIANVVPVLFALAGRRASSPAAAIGVAASIGYAGVLGGPPLLGLIAQASSVSTALWVVAALCVGIATVGGCLAEERKRVLF